MPAIGAIDVGANAIRMAVGSVDGERHLEIVERSREAVRLGQDVFTSGVISEETIARATDAFVKIRGVLDQHHVVRLKAVATSALREATNRDLFVDRIAQASGIDLQVIGAEEEARLIHLGVAEAIDLKDKLALLIDIGGGSVEVTLVSDGQIISTGSFTIGAVRLLQVLDEKKRGERQFNQLVHEYVAAMQRRLKNEIGNQKIDLCIGTGGNIESLGDLRKGFLGKDRASVMSADELEILVKKLQSTSFEDRIREMGLRPDRADVIVPAAIVLQRIMKQAGVGEVVIPRVGLREGLLLDVLSDLYDQKNVLHREQVLTWACQLGRKYAFDEQHGTTVAHLATQLFDVTKPLHNLDGEYRLLLEVAALLHDIGQFINISKHHKHTYYLLRATPIIGLSESQTAIVANVARYHRKSFPKPHHSGYAVLSAKDRVVTSKLAALLRVADAMDTEHEGRVTDFMVDYQRPKLLIRLKGEGDLLLEKWKLARKSTLFEEVFSVKVFIE